MPRLLTACALVFAFRLGAEEPQTATQSLIAGPAAVSAADAMSDAELRPIATRLAMVINPSESSTLASGIRELGKRDMRFAIATAEGFDGRKLTAGVAHFQLGSMRLDARSKSLNQGIAGKRFAATPTNITWQLSNQDLDDGRYVTNDDSHDTATLQITGQNAQVGAWRRFGPAIPVTDPPTWPAGPVIPSGPAVGNSPNTAYPLTIPEINMTKIQTSVVVPLGAGAIAAWDAQLEAMTAHANARDPNVAWELYRTSLEHAERVWPKATVVWTTMPLSPSRNTLRNYFNAQVRAYASAHAKPLLDIAAIQSTDENGQVTVDAEGERSNPAWVTPGNQPKLNADGSVRVARAWWWMQAKLLSASATVTPAAEK